MINVSSAICANTTTKVVMYIQLDGYWDDDNQWVGGGYTPALKLSMTPVPVWDNQASTHGQSLKTSKTGERFPAMMQFHSRIELPLNAVVIHNNIPYKLTRRGDYNSAGYWTGIGFTLPSFDATQYTYIDGKIKAEEDGRFLLTESDENLIIEDGTLDALKLKFGIREVSINQLLKVQR